MNMSGLPGWLHWGLSGWSEEQKLERNGLVSGCVGTLIPAGTDPYFGRVVMPGWHFLLPGFLLALFLLVHLAIIKYHHYHHQDVPALHHESPLNQETRSGDGNTFSGSKKRNNVFIARIKLEWQRKVQISRTSLPAQPRPSPSKILSFQKL